MIHIGKKLPCVQDTSIEQDYSNPDKRDHNIILH